MTRIAVFGATSQIARDYICEVSKNLDTQVSAFSRAPSRLEAALGRVENVRFLEYFNFAVNQKYDLLVNFIGPGNPVSRNDDLTDIAALTEKFDSLALSWLRKNPSSSYFFLSSGVASGFDFSSRPDRLVENSFNPEGLSDYANAKWLAEKRHKEYSNLRIIDIRLFSYFSKTQPAVGGFLMGEVIKALRSGEKLVVDHRDLVRDYIGPEDFLGLVSALYDSNFQGGIIDSFSLQPTTKSGILNMASLKFGLDFSVASSLELELLATPMTYYYSNSFVAKDFGYCPKFKSIDLVEAELRAALELSVEI